MPSAQFPLRQYPSSQTMRHFDALQNFADNEMAGAQDVRGHENGAPRRDLPHVHVQDFQSHDWPSSRRPSVGNNSNSSPRLKSNGAPSMPDLYQRLRQIPTPARSVVS